MANRVRLLIMIVVVLGLLSTFVWALSRRSRTEQVAVVTIPQVEVSPSAVPPVAGPTALPVPSPLPSVETEVTPAPEATATESAPTPVPSPVAPQPPSTSSSRLLIPVAGVRPEQLRDTFKDSRSEGRVHDAIDIPAPRGTPVLAAADGRIIKLFQSVPGGTTLYQLDPDNRTVYYYAHLDRYADGLAEGHVARRGEVIAYVGDTGNAGAGNYHLHFSVLIVADPKRYWDGTNINPYPLLVNGK
ncbi:MAG TPA: peptidoglycan DD-metalloendopeptidase family protein [Pyrinomonadaceae bacterium]|nr:peptidoglycan DD-metalloendopeptidase family protein [Pyrinomonadaceae bacterium]